MTAALAANDPVSRAEESFRALETYKVTLDSRSGDENEKIKYFYKKPGFIRMEFETPHKGAVLVYNPIKREVRLHPFGFMSSFELKLGPEDRLIRSSKGHTVDESDIGALLKNVRALADAGSEDTLGEENVNGRAAEIVRVEGNDGKTVDGTNKYLLWLDKTTSLPLKVKAFGPGGELNEEVLMDDLEVDPKLSEKLFEFK